MLLPQSLPASCLGNFAIEKHLRTGANSRRASTSEMHLQIILLGFLCSTLTAQNSEDYDLMYVNLENEIEHEILPTEDSCEMAILFPMRSKKIFGSVHPMAEMKLRSFSACTWVKVTEVLNKTILFSYGTKRNPYEIQLYLSNRSAVLTVNGDRNKIAAANVTSLGKWTHLCGTWSSKEGSMSLWVNGEMVISTSGMATDHIIPEGGILQIGQEKNGCCMGGGFDESLAFSGRLTGFNIWDRVLSREEIKSQTQGEDSCNIRGNVVGWGITEIQPHGGAQYIS
uniref:Pentraxin-related protein PTX3 n=1 Tax=Ornithorhynchus anatinus TaxID=9258 RepID=A0A6I8NG63_ORNAN